jgi:hypothetical protein
VYEIDSKIYVSGHFILGGHLRFGDVHFPLADIFLRGHLRLESSCSWVNTISSVPDQGVLDPIPPLLPYVQTAKLYFAVGRWKSDL